MNNENIVECYGCASVANGKCPIFKKGTKIQKQTCNDVEATIRTTIAIVGCNFRTE